MKKIFTFSLFTVWLCYQAFAQVTIWSENFNNGCASNCLASTHPGWTVADNDGGTTGSAPNNWFVSCAEEGIVPPGCGSTCVGDASLHIGANPGAGGDMGASYNETGATNATFRTARSPVISTVGYATITLRFDFIAFGSSACSDDRAQLRLSTDGGATWPVGFHYCLTSPCCGACNGYSQGQWTTYTLALPASFNNNPNVRIGFNWRNNGNGSGTDPSVAIDDIRLTVAAPLSITLKRFTANREGTKVRLNWETEKEKDFSHFEVQKSKEGVNFTTITKVTAKGNQQQGAFTYSFLDTPTDKPKQWYRLKMMDLDGTVFYSPIVEIYTDTETGLTINSVNTYNNLLNCRIQSNEQTQAKIQIFDTQGKIVFAAPTTALDAGENFLTFNIQALEEGVYIFKITDLEGASSGGNTYTQKFVLNR